MGLVVFFAATLASTKMVMIPDMDQGSVSVSISLPTGSSLEESTAIADRVTAIVQREVPELDEMYYLASNGSSMMSAGNSVTMGLKLVDKSDRDRSAFDIVDDLRSASGHRRVRDHRVRLLHVYGHHQRRRHQRGDPGRRL